MKKIGRQRSASLFDHVGREEWDRYLGMAFEHFVKQHADQVAQLLDAGDSLTEVGAYWQRKTKRKKGVQIDLVLVRDDGITTLVECKWSRRKTGMDAVHQLRGKAELYPNTDRSSLELLLVAAGGVTKQVESQRDIRVLTVVDLLAG